MNHAHYLGVAKQTSLFGECTRRKVGAIIVKDDLVVGLGWNGYPPGRTSCLDGGCPRARAFAPIRRGHDYAETGCVVIHAETRSIVDAGRERCQGATIYVNEEPCVLCGPLIADVGLARLVWGDPENFTEVVLQ